MAKRMSAGRVWKAVVFDNSNPVAPVSSYEVAQW